MTMRQIMVRAHEIARTLEGDYRARVAYGLRQAWTEARLIAAGGRLWEKNGMRRIYMNDLATLYGLKAETYGSGNIRKAWLDGEEISNSSARQLYWMLNGAKVWYDCKTCRFESKGLSEKAYQRIMTALGQDVEEAA